MSKSYSYFHALTSSLARQFGYKIVRDDRLPICNFQILDLGIQLLRRQTSHINFVQIGANDGVTNDPLHSHIVAGGLRGALVEPVPSLFEDLKLTYCNCPDLQFFNYAVSDRIGSLDLYQERSKRKDSKRQKTSAQFEHLVNHGIDASDIAKITVPCTTLAEVQREARLDEIDLLVTDTEGHDCKIIHRAFENDIEPGVIFCEVLHLSRYERLEIRKALDGRGYRFIESVKDCLAVKHDLLKMPRTSI